LNLSRNQLSRIILLVCAIVFLLPWGQFAPALARFQVEAGLLTGIVLALLGLVHPGALEKTVSRLLIQACVVLLGFRMDLHEVVRAGTSGLAFAIGTIAGTFALGWVLSRALKVEGKVSTLISSGTAICGGSAIAAVSSVIGANSTAISVATGTVFILNGIALFLFPELGRAMGLTPTQFGTWAGVAIHDISSVVGAAQTFASQSHAPDAGRAIDTATIVKLSRVLWIIPICLVAAAWMRSHAKRDSDASSSAKKKPLPIPWFIGLFILAAAARTQFPRPFESASPTLLMITKCGMALALFLIGAALSRKALREVGWRAMAQGVTLWIVISVVSFFVVRSTVA
jgi:uncharacterized integral membrane protein (TIGR00698 family)